MEGCNAFLKHLKINYLGLIGNNIGNVLILWKIRFFGLRGMYKSILWKVFVIGFNIC